MHDRPRSAARTRRAATKSRWPGHTSAVRHEGDGNTFQRSWSYKSRCVERNPVRMNCTQKRADERRAGALLAQRKPHRAHHAGLHSNSPCSSRGWRDAVTSETRCAATLQHSPRYERAAVSAAQNCALRRCARTRGVGLCLCRIPLSIRGTAPCPPAREQDIPPQVLES
ncbi:hypothetical protein B0H19DRAFT_1142231 [Mycena capillaripes]|nr:hypothetical protein B0H19DRAFT_1142231 [Mycena capillaripes]